MVQDKDDLRLAKLLSPQLTPEISATLLGYPDDEGIRINNGKPGAMEAPKAIREFLYKMTPESHWPVHPWLYDRGDLPINSKNIEQKQEEGRSLVLNHFKESGSLLITLGGGHDYGFPDGAGFIDMFSNKKNKPLVINFDAHMDVRPSVNGPNSGTPFRQLINEFGSQFDFLEVGIQPQCNSPSHRNWADEHGVKVITIDEIRRSNLTAALKKKVKANPKRPLFLSLDIDCFCSSVAPGCSASWPGGLTWPEVLPGWQWILKSFDLKLLGIYEVSPILDLNNQTSRLAAKMIYETLRLHLPTKSALAVKSKKR